MRICSSCGLENADGRDFCECGEYLRWEPTQHVGAVKPTGASEPAASPGQGASARSEPVTAPMDPSVTMAPGGGRPAAPASPPRAMNHASASASGPGAPSGPPPGAATLLLRLPDDDAAATGPVTVTVKPGERVTLLGLIRNESGIVDNYDISLTGLSDDWWTVTPATAYLVPYGTSGNYEQEIQIHLHPPRSPEAQARPWSFEVVAVSRAYETQVSAAPATLQIQPYQDVASKLAPDRASGRLKGRFVLTIRNRANARTEVVLTAEDTDGECEFRFAQPSVTIEPGQGIEAPFTVFPPKQIWIGRPRDRPIRVAATPVGLDTPQPPLPAIFRQRSWLPWWLAIVAPIAAAVLAFIIINQPKQTVVPNLKAAKSVFAAQKLLVQNGLKLSPQIGQKPDSVDPAGTIVDQSIPAGKKVKKGTAISIEVAVGSGMVKVPLIIGQTPVAADTTLREAGLGLGAVSPKPDPAGKIASQIPAPNNSVAKGTPVAVFLQPPPVAKGGSAAGAVAGAGAGAAGGAGAGAAAAKANGSAGAGGAAAGAAIVIPAVKAPVLGAAQQLSQAGLVPTTVQRFDVSPAGTVIGTEPAAGTSAKAGSTVAVIVSAGFPQLSYDDGTKIHVVDGATGKDAGTVPPAAVPQDQASWSVDGTRLVYVQGGQNAGRLVLVQPNKPGAQPFPMTIANTDDHNPALAPIANQNIVAFIDATNGGGKLCFATVGPNALNPSCTSHPGWTLGREVAWSPNGQAILVFGTQTSDHKVFGLIEFVSNKAFSTQASDWGSGTVVTDSSKPGQGVIYGAFSPDGNKVALVSNLGASDFHVFLVPSTSFTLAGATSLGIAACQVAWRPDGQALAVMQADGPCDNPTGNIALIDLSHPDIARSIATQAANPAWQPRSLGG